ncbi:hypothetical protein ILUMI_07047 [Ignelater luminosus]|uniref:Uncharacterized protein n=1 Tax=Ignelater luminosus TaxID=2038154 RepID=A0A8K0D488_IGNLU|nr:hypothetical protein ILUMI_07047 [Ignelater luminosus]
MDIVGGDKYLQDLDSERKLRTRNKDPPNSSVKPDSTKPSDDSDDSKNSNINDQSLKVQKRERRRSVGSPKSNSKRSDDIRVSPRSHKVTSENNDTPIIAAKISKTRSLLDEISNCSAESEMNKNGFGIKPIVLSKINTSNKELDGNKDNQKNIFEIVKNEKRKFPIATEIVSEASKNDVSQEKPKRGRRKKMTADVTNISNNEIYVIKETPKQKKRRSVTNEVNTSIKKPETNSVERLKQRRSLSAVAVGDNNDIQKQKQKCRRNSIEVIPISNSVNKSEKEKVVVDPNIHRIRSPKKIKTNEDNLNGNHSNNIKSDIQSSTRKLGSPKRTKLSNLNSANNHPANSSQQINKEEPQNSINETGSPKKIETSEIEIPNKEKLPDTLDESTNLLKINPMLEISNKKRASKVRKCLTSAMDSCNKSDEPSQIERISDLTVVPITHLLPNSEDIIDSSQEESSCSTSNYSETAVIIQKDIKEIQSTNHVTELEVTAITEKSETADVQNTQNTNNELSITNISISPDQLMEIDLAGSRNEKDISEMDTLTMGMEEVSEVFKENPESDSVSIPASPVAPDTPTRTNELINNTIDISPIKSAEIENDSDQAPRILEMENNDSTSNKIENVNKEKLISSSLPSCSSGFSKGNTTRAERLLAMVSHTPSPKTYKIKKIKSLDNSPYSIFLKTNRILKMMQMYGVKPDSEDIIEIEDDGEPHLISEEDVLEFTKELPSPMATPKFSILKRKAPETRSEGLSPPRKKRVNFTDPPTTCEKVYYNIKEEEETSPEDQSGQTKSIEDVGNQKPEEETDDIQKIPNGQQITSSAIPEAEEFIDLPVFQEVEIITSPSDNLVESDNLTEPDTESLNIATQGSMDNTHVSRLDHYNPIVPELIDCNESIKVVLKKTTTPVFVTHLQNELERKMLFTIGDLARLTEAEVMRLPFKTPKIKGVRSALLEYYESCKNDQIKMNIENETQRNQGIKVITEKILHDNQSESDKKGCSSQTISTTAVENREQNISTKDDNSQLKIQVLPLSPSTSSNVKILSSLLIEPARKIFPAVLQKNTEESVSPIGKTIKQVQLSEPSRPKISRDKELSSIRPLVCDENVEERTKLQSCMPELIEDFERIKEKAKRQGLHLSSLYELILEVVGIENYISVLQENKALTIDHLIKDDKDWNAVISDMMHRLGLNKIVSLLSATLKITPARFVMKVFDTLPNDISKDGTLERIACHALKLIPLQNVLRNFGMHNVVNALHEMKERLDFTVEDFFLYATFKFSPNINDMAPCFKNINTVRLEDTTLEMTDENKKDLNTFVEKVSNVAHKSVTRISEVQELVKDFPAEEKEKLTLALFYDMPFVKREECATQVMNSISLEQQQNVVTEVVDKMWKVHPDAAAALVVNKLVQGQEKILFDVVTKLSLSKQEKLTYTMVHKASLEKQKELSLSVFDKMSDADVFDCFTNYYRKRLQKK